jgi:hypothetical protein
MKITKQEIFNRVVEHLSTQKTQSVDLSGQCVYLDPRSGNKCAIGIFIPNGHEAADVIGSVKYLFNDYPDIEKLFENNSFSLLKDLQDLHDDCRNWNENGFCGWKRCADIALKNNLTLIIHDLETE